MGRYKIRTAFKIQSQQFKKHIANTVNWTETKPKKKKNSKKKLEERAKPCSAIKKRRGAGSGIQRWRKILMSARPKKKTSSNFSNNNNKNTNSEKARCTNDQKKMRNHTCKPFLVLCLAEGSVWFFFLGNENLVNNVVYVQSGWSFYRDCEMIVVM